jgi:hypothetical protein
MFHDHQYIEDSKGGTRYDEEVAGDDGRRVILEKGRPTLITTRVAGQRDREFWQIFPDGARRHAQAEFHQQLVGDSLLAPGRIIARHHADRTLEVGRNPRPAGLALVTPEELEALALPTDEGSGRHHRQRAAPIEPTAEQHEGHLCRRGSSAGFDFAFLIEPELFAQEQILHASELFDRKPRTTRRSKSAKTFSHSKQNSVMYRRPGLSLASLQSAHSSVHFKSRR